MTMLSIYVQAKQYSEVPKDIILVVTAAVTMSEDTGQRSVPISLKLTRFMLATLTFQFHPVFQLTSTIHCFIIESVG